MEFKKIEKYYGSNSILNFIYEIEKNSFNINNYFTKYNKRELSFEFNFNTFYSWYKRDFSIIDLLLKKIYYKKYYWSLNVKDNYIFIINNKKKYKINIENLIDIRVLIFNKFKIASLYRYKIIFYLVFYYIQDNKLKTIAIPYSGIKSLTLLIGRRNIKIETIPESEKTYFLNINDIVRLKSMFIRKNEFKLELGNTYKNIREESLESFEKKLTNITKEYSPFVKKMNNKFYKLVKLKEKEEKYIQELEEWENVKR